MKQCDIFDFGRPCAPPRNSCCAPCRCCCCCPPPCNDAAVCFRVTNPCGEGLACAVFTLSQKNCVRATAVSDAAGRVDFCTVPNGEYVLCQTCAPAGYRIDETAYCLRVADCGFTIEGLRQPYTIVNRPCCVCPQR